MEENSRPESRLGMSFSVIRGRLLIHHATIIELGEPEYIRFLYNDSKKRVAIQSCEKIDRDNFAVPKTVPGGRFQFELNSSSFLSIIYKKCGWRSDQTYVVYGTVYPEHRLVEFRLDDAKIISENQFVDPENLDGLRWKQNV